MIIPHDAACQKYTDTETDTIHHYHPNTKKKRDDSVYGTIEFYHTFKDPMVAVSGISIKSSGTLNDLILSFTG